MEEDDRMSPGGLILQYIAKNRKIILLWFGAAACFAVVFYLYELPLSAVLYALLLSGVFLAVAAALGFVRFCRRHRELSELKYAITVTQRSMPHPHDLIERDYGELVETVLRDRAKIVSKTDSMRSDMTEYYTAWVHQIKTPIAAMRLLLQSDPGILRQYAGCPPDQEREPAVICEPLKEELLEELLKTEQYVDMVLQYMRLDSESSDFLFREYSLDDIIRQAVRKFSGMFIRKKIALEYNETGIRVVTDEKWFLFVVEQILSNALKYTEHSGRIAIYAESGSDCAESASACIGTDCAESDGTESARSGSAEGTGNGASCRETGRGGGKKTADRRERKLIIEDSGIGIAPEDLARVFEKGFTGYNGRQNKKSTGIGLYLCRRVMDRLSHTIEIESEPGKGTKVKIGLDRYQLKGD